MARRSQSQRHRYHCCEHRELTTQMDRSVWHDCEGSPTERSLPMTLYAAEQSPYFGQLTVLLTVLPLRTAEVTRTRIRPLVELAPTDECFPTMNGRRSPPPWSAKVGCAARVRRMP